MARLLLLIAFCVLSPLARASRPLSDHFLVSGRVFCDHCRVGFETTNLTTYIEGASVQIGCSSIETYNLLFTQNGVTDANGIFSIKVFGDQQQNYCDVKLLQSNQKDCSEPILGREASRVTLTNFNGIESNQRYANDLGCMAKTAHHDCHKILEQYAEDGDEN